MNIWLYAGIGLILWVLWDLINGHVWFIHRGYSRSVDPLQYWLTWSLWLFIALGVTASGLS